MPDPRYNPRSNRVDMPDPRYHPQQQHQQYHSAEIHQEPRRHPEAEKRQQRSKSVPSSKSSHKHSDSKQSKEKSSKQSSSKSSKHKEKDKKTKSSATNLPDFIPIPDLAPAYHSVPTANPHQYDYRHHQARLTQGPYVNRGRPGVGVMFNPDYGTTDF